MNYEKYYKFLLYITRKQELENLIVTEKLRTKRKQGSETFVEVHREALGWEATDLVIISMYSTKMMMMMMIQT